VTSDDGNSVTVIQDSGPSETKIYLPITID
jgi:hypothetical protein